MKPVFMLHKSGRFGGKFRRVTLRVYDLQETREFGIHAWCSYELREVIIDAFPYEPNTREETLTWVKQWARGQVESLLREP